MHLSHHKGNNLYIFCLGLLKNASGLVLFEF